MKWTRVFALIAACGLVLPASPQPQPADVITVGTVTAPASIADVPVYIRDVSGTPLGIDQPPGSRIQSFSIRVTYSPAAPVQSVTFTRAGITAGLTPTFEISPSSPGSISLLVTFPEATNLVPFTSNAPAPGNLVGHLVFTLAPSTPAGTTIALTLDPLLTQLTDEGGSPATRETVVAGNLQLVSGAINVTGPSGGPTLDVWGLVALTLLLAVAAVRLRL
ncbi:MAG TPA: hypothetical protein VIW45_09230 [Vicinamibacterales bacterium]|jgi:hypothetical protein